MPVPGALLLCADPEVIGAPFYLMERVAGEVVPHAARRPTRSAPSARRALAMAMMDTLAALHGVDPAAVGLADFGRPEGFLARQVRRWARAARRAPAAATLPGIDELRDLLAATVPEGANAGRIVHGDYRLDNLLARPTRSPCTRCSTGRWPPSATRSPTWGCC